MFYFKLENYLLPKSNPIKVVFHLFLVLFLLLSLVLHLFLNLSQSSKPFLLVLFQLLNPLPDLFLLNDTSDQFLMFFRRTEPGKDFHHIVDFLFFLGSQFLLPHLLLKVQKSSCNDKFLALQSFVQLVIVNINQSEFHVPLLLRIIIVELHLCQK